ncbi:MAG TPA: hypothetical protein VKY42_04525 [Trueperaceae bacterium]|nr:hypothetical protein [Trueperaceae bacterium]
MRLRPPRRSRRLAALLLAVALGSAAAHPMLVIGEVAFEPDPPAPGAEALVTLTLQETSLAEVEDAVVFLELRPGPPPAGDSTPVGPPLIATDRLEEVSPGVYQASLTLPADGAYTLSVRDRTYRQEEAVANVFVELGAGEVGAVPFVLPPTAVGPASLGSWLIWLVGVPLLAGVLVTVLVLRTGRRAEDEEAGAE